MNMLAQMTFEERQEYKDFKKTTNLIVCSYSREEAFTEALGQLSVAEKYTIVAHTWCEHSAFYIFDEEGILNKYYVTEE